jgi:hypothetical protein
MGAAAVSVTRWPVLRTLREIRPQQDSTAAEEQIFHCTCRPDCFGYCRHTVRVRDGHVVKISLGPLPDPRYNLSR